jgi:hypothetical protein
MCVHIYILHVPNIAQCLGWRYSSGVEPVFDMNKTLYCFPSTNKLIKELIIIISRVNCILHR